MGASEERERAAVVVAVSVDMLSVVAGHVLASNLGLWLALGVTVAMLLWQHYPAMDAARQADDYARIKEERDVLRKSLNTTSAANTAFLDALNHHGLVLVKDTGATAQNPPAWVLKRSATPGAAPIEPA